MNLQDFIDLWQQSLVTLNRSINTITAYKNDAKDFKSFYEDYNNTPLTLENFKTLSPQDIRAWVMAQRKKNKNVRSSARALAALKSFTQFLLQREIIVDHAFFHNRSPKIQKTLPRPVSVQQALFISEKIGEDQHCPWIALRNQALIKLLYYTGMRISEALNLNQGILLYDQFITVLGKGMMTRQVPIIDIVRNDILGYLNAQPFKKAHDLPLFYGFRGKRLQPAIVQKMLRDFRRSQGLPESLTPHALRHSCASHLMQSSHDLRGIQELLGHASLSSTQIYTQIDEYGLMQSYKDAHPRAKKL